MKPCTCTLACIPEGIAEDQFCKESASCADMERCPACEGVEYTYHNHNSSYCSEYM